MTAADDNVREEMLSYDTCLISDALEKLGLPAGIAAIRRLTTRARVFGKVITVKLEPFMGEIRTRHLGTAAIDAAAPGDVIVVEHQARLDCAGWGGLLATAATARRVGGVVVDGGARDIDECEALAFPVFARSATPVTARNRVVEAAMNVRVEIAGVVVDPGDFVLADGSGVTFIPQGAFADVMRVARELLAFENNIRGQIDAGASLATAMSEAYERALRRL